MHYNSRLDCMKLLPILPAVLLFAVCAQAKTTYFVDPAKGNDANSGASADAAWRSFAKLESVTLGPGDKVVVAPGVHGATLHPKAKGTAENPAIIEFLPGAHEFAPEKAIRRPLFVSNSCDKPTEPKPFGVLVEDCTHLRLQGAGVEGALLLMGGRMIEAANLRSEDIAYSKLVFDLKRPTVSEYRVLETTPNSATVRIAEGSTYEIKDGKFRWTGDLGSGAVMTQLADPATGTCRRLGWNAWDPFTKAIATDLGDGKVRLEYQSGNMGMKPGAQYHFRFCNRDSVGIHNARSKDIRFDGCDIRALTNMGIVSQFTENLTFRHVRVAPPADTLRTCAAWADIFQFSNCRGEVLIEDCVESGMQDDAVNCHGTHLRIVGKPAETQLKLRYMQPQTYGFQPYVAGDEIAVIDHRKLRELPGNPRRKVVDCVQSDKEGKVWTITLDGPAPAFGEDDVVDNVTWHPNLTIRRSTVSVDPVRGYLITTRGKVVVEGCTFNRCAMPGILVEDDARGWFESTCLRDMTARNCRFIGCGIEINPQTESNDPQEPVHENIRILDNVFDGGGISVKGVKGLVVTGNKTPTGGKVSAHVASSCSEVTTD
jgi:hypothetical protein